MTAQPKEKNAYLIVGLGNPGKNFISTRHNIGREIAVALQRRLKLPKFSYQSKFYAKLSSGRLKKIKIIIALPETFMNNSGKAVAALKKNLKIAAQNIIVIHDDADIKLGSSKLSFGKSCAGHKGVESIIYSLKTKNFWRARIGIAGKKDIPAENLVLKKFSKKEKKVISAIIKKTINALIKAVTESPQKAMNEYNR